MLLTTPSRLCQWIPEPLGLMSIQEETQKCGFETDICDCPSLAPPSPIKHSDGTMSVQWGVMPGADTLCGYGYIGISSLTVAQRPVVRALIAAIRACNRGCTVVAGGADVSCDPIGFRRECPGCDWLVIGEGERAWPTLLGGVPNSAPSAVGDDQVAALLASRRRSGAVIVNCVPQVAAYELPPVCNWNVNRTRCPSLMSSALTRSVLSSVAAAHIKQASDPAYLCALLADYYVSPHLSNQWIESHAGLSSGRVHLRKAQVLFSRGCPNTCSFCCANRVMGREIRTRTPHSCAAEVLNLAQRGYKQIEIIDDNVSADPDWLVDVLSALPRDPHRVLRIISGLHVRTMDSRLAYALKTAGLKVAELAIESTNPRVQRILGKPLSEQEIAKAVSACRQAGLYVIGYFLIGVPGQTRSDMYEALDAPRRLGLDSARVFPFKPYRGCVLTERAERDGMIGCGVPGMPHAHYVQTSEFSPSDIHEVYQEARRRFPDTDWSTNENYGLRTNLTGER